MLSGRSKAAHVWTLALAHATTADIKKILDFIDQLAVEASWRDREHYFIKLAVEEACANVFEHTYHGQPGRLALCVEQDADRRLLIQVKDWGDAFDPTQVPAATTLKESLDERTPGGLGLHFIRHVMDTVSYRRSADGCNILSLRKQLTTE